MAEKLTDPAYTSQWIELGQAVDQIGEEIRRGGVEIGIGMMKVRASDVPVLVHLISESALTVQQVDRIQCVQDRQRYQCVA